MRNALDTVNDYRNGDGFATERGTYDITLRNVIATGNSDGGLDLKRSEEHTSELQSLMRISYAVFCLKKKKTNNDKKHSTTKIELTTKIQKKNRENNKKH